MRPASFLPSFAFLCVSLTAIPAFADDQPLGEYVQTMRVDGEIEVGPDGRVTAHGLQTAVTDEIRGVIERSVATWSFHPPMANGAPATTHGKMRITLSTRSDAAENPRVENVTFLGADAAPTGHWALEGKPAGRHRLQTAGAVAMQVRLAPDGRVLEAFPSQCTVFSHKAGRPASKACDRLERYAMQSVRNWKATYRPARGEAIPTAPSTGTVAQFFTWHAHDRDTTQPGQWRAEWRTPYKAAPWREDTAPRIGASDVTGADGLISDATELRLRGNGISGASE